MAVGLAYHYRTGVELLKIFCFYFLFDNRQFDLRLAFDDKYSFLLFIMTIEMKARIEFPKNEKSHWHYFAANLLYQTNMSAHTELFVSCLEGTHVEVHTRITQKNK